MDANRLCEECGAESFAKAPRDLCPDCLNRIVVRHALARLRAECLNQGKLAEFYAAKAILTGRKSPPTFTEFALEIETNEIGLKRLESKLRWRFGELWCEEITSTLIRLDDANK